MVRRRTPGRRGAKRRTRLAARCNRRVCGLGHGFAGKGATGNMRSLGRRGGGRGAIAVAISLATALLLSGCGFTQTYYHGYVVQEGALEQIPLGATQEQVLIVLGTPSTVATVNGEAFYYISQRAEQKLAFLPQQVTNQRVIGVYFDKQRRVEPLAHYALKDGRPFDFVSR